MLQRERHPSTESSVQKQIRGAARAGIGEATVTRLVAQGARVIIADIAEGQGLKLAESLHGNAAFCRCDVACAVARPADLSLTTQLRRM